MSPEMLRDVLAWCSLINLIFLALWFLGYAALRDWMHGLHAKWFRLSDETFDAIHYAGMALFKMMWLVFNVVPYLVLRAML